MRPIVLWRLSAEIFRMIPNRQNYIIHESLSTVALYANRFTHFAKLISIMMKTKIETERKKRIDID